MKIPAEFDAIRPYEPEELPEALASLLHDEAFVQMVSQLPGLGGAALSQEQIAAEVLSCRTSLEFQKKFVYPVLAAILSKASTGQSISIADPEFLASGSCTYISNHRDIVLDAAILDKLLVDNGIGDTVEIAIGDNLLAFPWITRLVRINKAFIVHRSLPMREMLLASKRLSRYMHYCIAEKQQSIWIAQREGRAKDSDDRTQPSLLKMMAMGGTGSDALDSIAELNLVPLTITCEYDPCDFLKAREMQLKRDDKAYKKTKADDLQNMQTGIFGFKGTVHYHIGTPVNTWLEELRNVPKAELFNQLAQRIDRSIHAGYRVFAHNYVALDLLDGTHHADSYTPEDKARFEAYIAERINLIDLPARDEDFLRGRLLTMYANPLRNYLYAQTV